MSHERYLPLARWLSAQRPGLFLTPAEQDMPSYVTSPDLFIRNIKGTVGQGKRPPEHLYIVGPEDPAYTDPAMAVRAWRKGGGGGAGGGWAGRGGAGRGGKEGGRQGSGAICAIPTRLIRVGSKPDDAYAQEREVKGMLALASTGCGDGCEARERVLGRADMPQRFVLVPVCRTQCGTTSMQQAASCSWDPTPPRCGLTREAVMVAAVPAAGLGAPEQAAAAPAATAVLMLRWSRLMTRRRHLPPLGGGRISHRRRPPPPLTPPPPLRRGRNPLHLAHAEAQPRLRLLCLWGQAGGVQTRMRMRWPTAMWEETQSAALHRYFVGWECHSARSGGGCLMLLPPTVA